MALKFKTFDSLMADIESDLRNYADEGLFDRMNYIRTVRKVNADLGLKIHSEKEDMLEVRDYKATLPLDFLYLQLALGCEVSFVKVPQIRGTQTIQHSSVEEEVPVEIIPELKTCNINSCGNTIWITQKIGHKIYKYESLDKLSITKSSWKYCTDTCLNFRFNSGNQMSFAPDGETVNFSFREGKVYISYLSDMIDCDNNILVLDHPLVNDYYEYAVKKKFFENMELGKEGDFLRDFQLVSEELRKARIAAISFVNTPEYGEIIGMFNANRKRFYNNYIRYFDEYRTGIFRS